MQKKKSGSIPLREKCKERKRASYRIDRLPVMGGSTADFTLFDEFVYSFCLLKKMCQIKE